MVEALLFVLALGAFALLLLSVRKPSDKAPEEINLGLFAFRETIETPETAKPRNGSAKKHA